MNAGKLIRGALFATLAAGLLVTGPGTARADGPGDSERVPAGTPGGALPRNDSEARNAPASLRNLPPVKQPAPGNVSAANTAPGESVGYNPATKETALSPAIVSAETDAVRSVPGNVGLLGELNGPESIIGVDNRTRIFNTEDYPWRTVVHLIVNTDNGTFVCSGAMIDSRHVLTAGHCISNPDFGGPAPQWANSITVVPGDDDGFWPYNFAVATWWRTYTSWTNSRDWNHDWAVLLLDRDVGTYTGWMGRVTASSGNAMYTGIMNVAGYPADKGGDQQWFDTDPGCDSTEYKHWYTADTTGGMSGGPVWRYLAGPPEQRHIMTIHAYAVSGCGNSGTRLNQDKFDQTADWLAFDAVTPVVPVVNRPDLVDNGASNANITPNLVQRGVTNLSVTAQVANIGTANAGTYCVAFYLSTNTIISTGDVLLGTDCSGTAVNAFSTVNVSWSGVVPAGTAPGTYYVGWIIDSNNVITEFVESNNTGYESGEQLVVEVVPSISVNNATGAEGGNVGFTVTLSPASGFTVNVSYNTSGVLDATAGVDYTVPGPTVLTYTPGQTTKTVNIATIQDTLDENNEQFNLILFTPVNATISDGTGIGTITDDDAPPSLSINNVSLTEGNVGPKNFNFTVDLSTASGKTVTVNYNTTNGTALAGFDYVGQGTTGLTFTPGQTSKTVTVVVNGDTVCEPNQTFNVNLGGAVNATIADNLGLGRIDNDDGVCTTGGKNLSITTNSIDLAWDGGNAQTGYQLVQYNTNTAAAILIPLGAGVTSYSAPVGGAMYCYLLAATADGGAVLGMSDLECALPGQESGPAVPGAFTLELNGTTNATLTWTNAPGVTANILQVIPLNGNAPTNVPLGPAVTSSVQAVANPEGSCFQLIAFQGATPSLSDVLCGIPGLSTLSTGAGNGPGTVGEAVEVVKEKAKAIGKRAGGR